MQTGQIIIYHGNLDTFRCVYAQKSSFAYCMLIAVIVFGNVYSETSDDGTPLGPSIVSRHERCPLMPEDQF